LRRISAVKVNLKAGELDGQLVDGVSCRYWTFNGKVPGPFLRVRVGDTVELTDLATSWRSAQKGSIRK
jgi:nitrite reductase (NO-forming)